MLAEEDEYWSQAINDWDGDPQELENFMHAIRSAMYPASRDYAAAFSLCQNLLWQQDLGYAMEPYFLSRLFFVTALTGPGDYHAKGHLDSAIHNIEAAMASVAEPAAQFVSMEKI